MDAARAAVAKFTSRRGHFTDVTETVRPAVTYETIKPTRHEIITSAVDREVHKDHYHTTVQPLHLSETLPAVHSHNLIPVKHEVFRHGNEHEEKEHVARELARFVNVSFTEPTTHSRSELPAVIGEHVHHHIHETVQPVIYKETILRETVHMTLPVHETHHNQSIHHNMSSLPLVTMEEFGSRGGVLSGMNKSVSEQYEGSPREYNSSMHTTMEKLGLANFGATNASPTAAIGAPAAGMATSPTTGHRRSNKIPRKKISGRDNSDSGVSGISSSESENESRRHNRQRHSLRA